MFKSSKRAGLLFVALVSGGVFLSCGSDTSTKNSTAQPMKLAQAPTELNRACHSTLFNLGRSLSASDLRRFPSTKFALESVLFRDVLYRSPYEVELAYLVEVKMRLSDSSEGQFLVPDHDLLCRENPHPSIRSNRLSRTMIPVLGDLHLPSTRITVFDTNEGDRLYNYPRISEISVSSNGYFSFNQNWTPYRRMQTLSDYIELLRSRHFYSMIDVREMDMGRIGIYAEKNIGGEKAQLLVTLSEVQY